MPSTDDFHHRRQSAARRRVYLQRRLAALVVAVVCAVVGYSIGNALGSSGAHGSAAAPGTTTRAGSTTSVTPRTPAPSSARVSLTAVGDIMMGTPQFGLPPANGSQLFTAVKPLLTGDVVLGNLEGTLTTRSGAKCGAGSSNCFAFQSPPAYVRNLVDAGFNVLNVANNHAYDFGPQGQADTIRTLRGARIPDTGRPGRFAVLTTHGGVRVAVLGFSTYKWSNRMTDLPAARALVRRAAAQADLVVVNMHAGAEGSGAQHVRPGTEYFLGENRGDVIAFSHAVIDAGADLVVGNGPHVLRAMGFYKGRLIAFSDGNFVGWRAFSIGGVSGVSCVLHVTLGGDGRFISGDLKPVQLVGSGAPSPGGPAVGNVRALSQQDLRSGAAQIGADGSITPPTAATG